MPNRTVTPSMAPATPAHSAEWIERAAAQFVLDAILAERGIRQIVANGAYAHELTEPLFCSGPGDLMFLIVPPNAEVLDVLAYVQAEARQPVAA